MNQKQRTRLWAKEKNADLKRIYDKQNVKNIFLGLIRDGRDGIVIENALIGYAKGFGQPGRMKYKSGRRIGFRGPRDDRRCLMEVAKSLKDQKLFESPITYNLLSVSDL